MQQRFEISGLDVVRRVGCAPIDTLEEFRGYEAQAVLRVQQRSRVDWQMPRQFPMP